MALQCNIDSRGKVARLIYGIIFLLGGIILTLLWAWGTPSILRWVVSIGCAGMGAVAIFEARAGWCVVRAMGFKTRL